MKKSEALGTGEIKDLLWKFSLPSIIAMIASSLYNIVDSIFIGRGVGALAISGLAITFPLMNLSAAFGTLIGAGGSTLISIRLGQKNFFSAEKILGNVVSLKIIISVIFTTFGLIFLKEILEIFGASEKTLPFAYDYMLIIMLGSGFTHLYFGLNNVLRSAGFPTKAMLTTLMTVFVNALLDWLFIFEFGWGIRGAAFATVLSQFSALLILLFHFSNKKNELHFRRGIFRPNLKIAKQIFSIGMAPFVLNACACLVVIIINQSLYKHGGDLAVGAYGIVNRMMMLFGMLVLGFNQGMQPIAGYNFGAGKMERVVAVLRRTIVLASLVMIVAFVVAEFFPRQVSMLFTTDKNLLDLSEYGMRIAMICAPIVGFQMVTANFFQSVGKASRAIFLSATRQLIFLVPLLLILPHFFGVTGVWVSLPISDAIAATLALILLMNDKIFKK